MSHAKPHDISPPRAAIRRHSVSAHGLTWSDDYAWIRAENWREVLRDPALLPHDIRTLLEAENAYCEALLAPTKALQRQLAREMRARLKEDDREPPQVDGPFAYFSRFRRGGQHRIYCRMPRAGGRQTVLIDGDERAEGKPFFHLAFAGHSPDHSKFAWSADELGSEMNTISARDLGSSEDLADRVERATGDIVWTRDSRGFLYVEQDENHRPCRVALHRLGTPQAEDVTVFEESDPAWFIAIAPTRLGRSAFIAVHGHDASEALIVDLDHPASQPLLIAPRRPGFRYEAFDHGEALFIRTNAGGARDFKIVSAPRATPQEAHWRDVVAHEPGRFIEGAALFKDYLVLLSRQDGTPRFTIHDLVHDRAHGVAFEEETYDLKFGTVYEFDTAIFRFSYASMTCSQETFDYDIPGRRRILRKKQMTPPDFDPAAYVTRRAFAPASDGERVPISLLMRRDAPLDGSAPLLLYGYGAYGLVVDANFSPNRFSLVDRGFVYAIAHIRGGSEKGFGWYEDGKLARKPNTFSDFLAVARHLIAEGYTAQGRIVAHGGSAGGMLMGAAANMAPELLAGVIADVPFVDVLATMLDASLPLTPAEWNEWGNPIHDAKAFETIRSYSPVDNVRAQGYPAILALAGLTDPRVTYWEPAKWVAKLRATMTGGGPILLRTAMESGHAGAPGRFDRLDDVARSYAFAIACVNGEMSATGAAGNRTPGGEMQSRSSPP